MDTLQAALRYLNHGLAVIPTWPDSRKNPMITSYQEHTERLPSQGDVRRWFRRWPRANVAIITGYWLNYCALDFDSMTEYTAWASGAGVGLVGQTWTVATARGRHVWFQLPAGADVGKSRMYVRGKNEVLLRARGGYCIAPPSRHHTGAFYRTAHRIPVARVEAVNDILGGWVPKTAKNSRPAANLQPSGPIAGRKIEDLVTPLGKPNGRGAYKAHCPFHADKTPSAWVNPKQGRFGCNACWPDKYWDVVNVYAKLHDLSNREAYKQLMTGV